MVVFVLSILLCIITALAILLGVVALKFGKALLLLESSINDTLDKLDKEYQEIGDVIRQPLASDDPSVLRVHKAIKRCQNSVLEIANVLSKNWNSREDSAEAENSKDTANRTT